MVCGVVVGVQAEVEAEAPVLEVVEAVVDEGVVGPLVLEARVQSIDEQHRVNFNEEGEPNNENHSLRVQLVLTLEGDQPIMGYHDLVIDRVVTDAAEELRSLDGPGNSGMMHNIFGHQQRNPRKPQIGVHCRLPVPSHASRSLSEVSGHVVLKLAEGPMKEAVLGPFGEVAGKRARIEGMAGSEVSLRERQGNLRVEMSQEVRERLNRLRVVDGRGVELPAPSRGSGSNGMMQYVDLRLAPEAGHRVVLELFDRVVEREAVFTVHDVPLPGAEANDGGVELVLDLVPVGEGLVGVEVEAGVGLPRLPVVVEE